MGEGQMNLNNYIETVNKRHHSGISREHSYRADSVENNMNIAELKREYNNAGRGWFRAAFGSLIRRNYSKIKDMTADEKRQLVKGIGAPDSYMSELSKELKGIEYDLIHKHINS